MSRPAFFNSGRTWARLKQDGNVPVWNDRFASLAMTGANTAEDAFRSGHGSASSGDDLAGIADSSRVTSSVVTCENDDSVGPTLGLVAN